MVQDTLHKTLYVVQLTGWHLVARIAETFLPPIIAAAVAFIVTRWKGVPSGASTAIVFVGMFIALQLSQSLTLYKLIVALGFASGRLPAFLGERLLIVLLWVILSAGAVWLGGRLYHKRKGRRLPEAFT